MKFKWIWMGALCGLITLNILSQRGEARNAANDPLTDPLLDGQNISALKRLQDKQNAAISRARFSVVSVRAFNGKGFGTQNIGAGVVISPDCHIITNNHVIGGFDWIEVSLIDSGGEQKFRAQLVQKDPTKDLALLKVSRPTECYHSELIRKQTVQIGETVLVIGSPFGFKNSVSRGVVSKVSRDVEVNGVVYQGMFQTDASINQGNSGGPIINLNGDVVGVATVIFSEDGNSSGVGFAIPTSQVFEFAEKSIVLDMGARLVAAKARTAQGGAKERINLTEKVPHGFLGDCTKCHTLAYKTPIKPADPMPHPNMGSCMKCHTFTDKKVTQPVLVASQSEINNINNTMGYLHRKGRELVKIQNTPDEIGIKSVKVLILYNLIMLGIILGFVWFYYKTDVFKSIVKER